MDSVRCSVDIELCPPHKEMGKSYTSGLQNVTLLGNGVIGDVLS